MELETNAKYRLVGTLNQEKAPLPRDCETSNFNLYEGSLPALADSGYCLELGIIVQP